MCCRLVSLLNKLMKTIIALITIMLGIWLGYQYAVPPKPAAAPVTSESTLTSESFITEQAIVTDDQQAVAVKVIATNLQVPWAIAFLPTGDMLVTERSGTLKQVSKEGMFTISIKVDDVLPVGEGGLLGVALHPEFAQNNYVYLYYTYSSQDDQTLNRVVRYKYLGNSLTERLIIVDKIPGASNHNGGRLKFGPDNYLYITTGDASNPSLSQTTSSLAGKILRVTDEGKPAPGNPFNNEVYSYGHRNPQGIAWIDSQLWSTEHGPTTLDELNKIQAGNNYGWSVIRGDQQRAGMITPVINSGIFTWAPGGLAYLDGKLYFTGLRGLTLYIFDPTNSDSGIEEYLKGEYGRLREVTVGPDKYLYITTSNHDGRGDPKKDDDKILRINPKLL